MRRRLDEELVRRGLVGTRAEATGAIREGRVLVRGSPAVKPGTLVGPDDAVSLAGPSRRFVSRAGEKLDAALDRFGVQVRDRRALDAGASTGGFTDCLLQRGAAHVVAVDVGYGQLAWSLREDRRVTVLERTNARDLVPEALPYRAEVVTADLSFISLASVVPALVVCSAARADLVLLVKPQFEAGRAAVGKGGVVRDPEAWRQSLSAVWRACAEAGAPPVAVTASPLLGPAGNAEFFVHARVADAADEGAPRRGMERAIEDAVAEAARLRERP